MHLLLCAAGTVLAMAGHLRRTRLWLPHIVGLITMVAVSYDVGGATGRAVGIAALVALVPCVLPGLRDVRDRAESVIDTVAMVLLVAAAPSMATMSGSGSMHGHAMVGRHAMASGASSTVAVSTLVAWAIARVVVVWLTPGRRDAAGPSGLTVVALAGSSLMVAGMTLMSV